MIENKETFLARITPTHCDDDCVTIELAYIIAKHGARHDNRSQLVDGKVVRSFEHFRGVALTFMDRIKCMDTDGICAALLHDSLEDFWKMNPRLLERVSNETGRMVRMLSKIPKEGYVQRLRDYADWRVLAVKLCDRHYNMGDLATMPEAKRLKQIKETREEYLPLFRKLLMIAPEQYRPGIAELIDEIVNFLDLAREADAPSA